MSEGAKTSSWAEYRSGWKHHDSEVIEEALITLYINGFELASIMATPLEQKELALGFLKNEGLLDHMDEVEEIYVTADGCCVDLWLNHAVQRPERFIITSGCGAGISFDDPSLDLDPLVDDFCIEPERLFERFQELHFPGSLHARARGVHTAGLSDGEQILAISEDVGRHNTIDKLLGKCLLNDIETRGKVLLTTGRVSSEMLRKGARMGCPIIASRNSPTSLSISMAEAFNITLVGYVRRNSLRVYSHTWRLNCEQQKPV
ncbi:MAG: formate dehydrogenase accessory sulfurtransferase FdhD [Anaerolineales bacterium]|nr:formate dehydrogenase accessory sulfurtransferase FdhD [Anaerolineales bacterium]